jgi:hypothetical protein
VKLPSLWEGADTSRFTTVPAPGVQMRRNMAMATSSPWIDSNVWQYRRAPGKAYFCDVSAKSVELAMAEAHSQEVELALKIAPAQRKAFDKMTAFLKALPEGPTARWANIAISDDGSGAAAEALNLLSRRNLLYKPGPDAKADLTLRLSKDIRNPYDFMREARQKLGDGKRILRLFGSEITLAEVRRDSSRVRIFLINYGTRAVESLRVRIQGHYSAIEARVYQVPEARLTDAVRDGAFTEFSLSRLPRYAVVDLKR